MQTHGSSSFHTSLLNAPASAMSIVISFGCLALPEVDACSDLSLSESLNRGSAAKLRLCAIFNLFG